MKDDVKSEYHTFHHIPSEVRERLGRLGLNVKQLEEDMKLRIIDSYSPQTGLREEKDIPSTGDIRERVAASMRLSDWSISDAKLLKGGGISEENKRWFHVDDDVSILLNYNQEREFLDYWRLRNIPSARAQEQVMLHGVLTGTASEQFYRKFESLSDGIIEFRSEEKALASIEQFVRVSTLRNKTCDTRWRRLNVLDTGEVKLADST